MATLAIYRGDQFDRRIELGATPLRIGRAPENDIVLEDPTKGVSRAHAQIRFEEGRYLIADLNSQHGVWLGGERITRDPLPIDAPITIGAYRLVVEYEPHTPWSLDDDDAAAAEVTIAEAEFVEPAQLTQPASPPSEVSPAVVVPPSPPTRRPPFALVAGGVVAAGLGVWAAVAFVNRPDVSGPVQPAPSTTTSVRPEPPPSPPAVPEPAQRGQDFKDHLANARAAFEDNDKATAIREIGSALEMVRDDAGALALRDEIEKLPDSNQAPPPPLPVPPPAGPPVAVSFTVVNKARETPRARREREKNAQEAFLAGLTQFDNGNYQAAIASLESAVRLSERRDFGRSANEAQSYIERSKDQLDSNAKLQRTKSAQGLIVEAKALAPTDVAAAIGKMREAQDADAAADALPELRATLFAQAAAEGERAYSDAKNKQARRRTSEALIDYTRAVKLLEFVPGGHEQMIEEAKKQIRELSAIQ